MLKNLPLACVFKTPSAVSGALALSLLMLTTGCASVGGPQESKTLATYEQLQVQPDGSRAWRSSESSRYDAVRIDLAAITFGTDVKLDAQQREQLQISLTRALKEKFASAGLPETGKVDSRRTVSVRATFTSVDLANPALNAVTTVLLWAPLSRGGVTLEMEAVDTDTGQRVAALALAGKAGVENITSAFSSIGHAKLQADLAAERFVALLTGKTTEKSSGSARDDLVATTSTP
jgi:hypothetical protein